MPTFVHGSGVKVYVGGYDLTSYVTDVKAGNAVDKADTTTMGNTSKTSIPGLEQPSMMINTLWSSDASGSDERLKAILGVEGTVITIVRAGDTVGANAELAKGYGAKFDPGSKIAGAITLDAEIELNKGLDLLGHVLHEKKAETTTSTGSTTVDRGAANTTSLGYAANLQAFAFVAGIQTLTVIVEHSTNNSTWATLDTFTALSASGFVPTAEQKTGTTPVNRYVRVRWTFVGSTPSCTFQVAIGIRGDQVTGLTG